MRWILSAQEWTPVGQYGEAVDVPRRYTARPLPARRPIHINDVLTTINAQLGVPTDRVHYDGGRPVPVLRQNDSGAGRNGGKCIRSTALPRFCLVSLRAEVPSPAVSERRHGPTPGSWVGSDSVAWRDRGFSIAFADGVLTGWSLGSVGIGMP